MAVGNFLPSSRKAPNIALVASHLARWTGGNDFLRICAAGLWQKQHNTAFKFAVFIPDELRLQTLRRHLAPWRRWARDLISLQGPRFAIHSKSQVEQVMDAVNSFGGELETVIYRDRRDSYKNLLRCLLEQNVDVMLPIQF